MDESRQQPVASHTLRMDNYNWMRSVDKRLHIVGDWVLPFAVPYRVIGLFVVVAVPQWTIMGLFGVPVSLETFWWYVLPPAVVAGFANALKVQGKPLVGWLLVNLRFWARRPVSRSIINTRRVIVSTDIWSPDHPAYEWQRNVTERDTHRLVAHFSTASHAGGAQ